MFNRRYASKEQKISPETAETLSLRWKFNAGKDVTATPAIFNNTLYFPSWNGYIYALKASDGSVLWKQNLQELTGLNATGFIANANWTLSRSTPTVADDLLVIGIYGPAVVIAVKRESGELVWIRYLDDRPGGVITMSGTYYNRLVCTVQPFVLTLRSYNFVFCSNRINIIHVIDIFLFPIYEIYENF